MSDSNDLAVGYAMGQDSGSNGYNGMWGGEMFAFLLFAMMFGGGWGGFGGLGGFGGFGGAGAAWANGALTRADLCQDMNFAQLENGVRGISQGICDSTFALTNAINSGFSSAELSRCNQQAALMQQLNNMSFQAQNCCCETQGAIKDLSYQMAKMGCDIIQSTHNDTDRIIGWLSNQETQRLRDELQTYKFAASQANQNNVIGAQIDAMGAEIIRRVNPQAIPAYVVPNPNVCAVNTGCNTGCGYAC